MEHENLKEFTDKLSESHAGFVLITCEEPTADGNMKVKMSYGGDNILVSYLINGAQNLIEERLEENQNCLRLIK